MKFINLDWTNILEEGASVLVDNIEITDSYFTDSEIGDSIEYSILVPVSMVSEKAVGFGKANIFSREQGKRLYSVHFLPNGDTAIISESRIENILVKVWFAESWQRIATKRRVIESLEDINKDIDKIGKASISNIENLVERKVNKFFEDIEQGLLYYDRRKQRA